MIQLPSVNISDFNYQLPTDRIAQFPLGKRDNSKLIINKNNIISEDIFSNIQEYLPANSLLISNSTKVIQARLLFQKTTGAKIEIFCLEPHHPTKEIQQAFLQNSGVVWECLVGNSKKWKENLLSLEFDYNNSKALLNAKRVKQLGKHALIEFTWQPEELTFSEILLHSGVMPLPPYMHRKSEEADKYRYQTVYAKTEGSVAAPTAGLHFTDQTFSKLKNKGITIEEVTLHVGAGTFVPISESSIANHTMHAEQIIIEKKSIENLINNIGKPIIAVGTTTVRTIESLYWYGVKLLIDKNVNPEINIQQWDPYQSKYNCGIGKKDALEAVLTQINSSGKDNISGQTQLIIVPGYQIKIPDILITNFHMPKSTLLLLVSAFIGDQWKAVYDYALNHKFRFLSYGDSCLFFKRNLNL